MMMALSRRRRMTVYLIAALLCAMPVAHASDYVTTDAEDKDALERALYLCVWRATMRLRKNSPTPAVCTSASVSIDDALLQKQTGVDVLGAAEH